MTKPYPAPIDTKRLAHHWNQAHPGTTPVKVHLPGLEPYIAETKGQAIHVYGFGAVIALKNHESLCPLLHLTPTE